MLRKHIFRAVFLAELAVLVIVPFAPAYVSAAVNSPFRLPVGPGLDAYVSQGNNGSYDHKGVMLYAFDFTVGQTNFPVVTVQSGKVIGADDTSTFRCDDANTLHVGDGQPGKPYPGCWTKANYVLIQNDGTYDGQTTAALYMHLLPHSLRVQMGDTVKRGDLLGLADTTGWASGTHLHFQLEQMPSADKLKNKQPGWWFTQSLPVAFSNPELLAQPQSTDGVPKETESIPLSGTPLIIAHPGGQWRYPKDGTVITTDSFQASVYAHPTNVGDPAIAKVEFTIGSTVVNTVPAPKQANTFTWSIFTCSINLKQLGISSGKFQFSFNVIDVDGNKTLAPNGVHTLNYSPQPVPGPVPTPTPMPDFSPFVGVWYAHSDAMSIKADGSATYTGRVFVWCTDDPRQPCDQNSPIIGGLNAKIVFTSISGNTAQGKISTGGTGDRDIHGNVIPVGSNITITLNPNDTLTVSDGKLLCGPEAIKNVVDQGCVSGA